MSVRDRSWRRLKLLSLRLLLLAKQTHSAFLDSLPKYALREPYLWQLSKYIRHYFFDLS